MTRRGSDDGRTRDFGALLGVVLASLASGLLWVVIVMGIRWALQLPPPILLRVGLVALLFAGSALVFAGLIHVELSGPRRISTREEDRRRAWRLRREAEGEDRGLR